MICFCFYVKSCDTFCLWPQKLAVIFIKIILLFFSDEEEEDDVVTPKPPIEPEEEKILKKDEENDNKGILKNLTLKNFVDSY